MECPRCKKEINKDVEMVKDGIWLRCRLCGYKIPVTHPWNGKEPKIIRRRTESEN